MNLFDLLCSPFVPKRQPVEAIDFMNPKKEDSVQAPPQLPLMTVVRESPRPPMLVCETEAIPHHVSIDEIRTDMKPFSSERFYEKLRYIRDSFTGTAKGSGSASTSSKIRACQVAPETTIELPKAKSAGDFARIPSHIARNRRRRNAIGGSRQFMESIELAPIRENPESAANSARILPPETFSEVHPINILCDALLQNVENVENYEFHCKNVSENLRAFVPAHNNIADKIQHVSHYNRIRSQSGGDKSVSCPNFAEVSHASSVRESHSTGNLPWTPPETHGLENSQQIIPNYYFRSFERTRGGRDRLIDIDYMFIIKDDIRNMRKLNPYQLDYIYNLGDQEKNEIITEINAALRATVDHLCMISEDEEQESQSPRRQRHRRVGSA